MKFNRIFIEKKEEFNTEGKLLLKEFRDYLEVDSLTTVKVVNVYDLINVTEEEKEKIVQEILFEETLDNKYENSLPIKDNERLFRVEFLKGQYNQREDSTNQIIRILTKNEDIIVQNSKIIILENVTDEELNKIKKYYINPIEMKEIGLDSFSFEKEEENLKDIEIISDFMEMTDEDIQGFKSKYGIGMDIDDLKFCKDYFKNIEKRNPTITELKLIDTYWSDHCRHTTFMTEITEISMGDGQYKEVFQKALDEYIKSREFVYENRERAISLMDLATINMKETKKKGLLDDKEETDEVNACSVEIDVDIDGTNEKWLLMFKNETHNHPTEMEPFGGASTCLGGAIRDPLSGRAYVYQAMRITGSGDPRQKYEDTLSGKLPQRKITKTAKAGYSSYGYEIGGATGYVREIYDAGYMAKRMELGALVAAAPKKAVYRGESEPGDLIILVGGKTGRDGLGGAVGSSKEHTEESLHTSGAEVQKGNPAVERKIVRLFRNEEVSKMIKKCNDFGAGGVSVAIGELADGLLIELDKVPLKYPGLDGTEIALSESQERMAVVISPKDLERFMSFVKEEDVEGTVVATVTEEKVLKMIWRNKTIVNIKRDFLDTNGIRKKNKVNIELPKNESYLEEIPSYVKEDIKEAFIENLKDLNICSQKGLVEGFDHTVGAGTVLMPLGGKYNLTPAEGMVAKIPVLEGNTNTCSLMTYGYDPKLSKWSPFHGGYYAVIESIAKIVAMGGDYKKVRLTFQEYFERLGDNPTKWGKPFSALLGAFMVQKELDTPSIGGKDSMSGTFEDINVPPTLVSFAVTTDKVENIISKEFKNTNSTIALLKLDMDKDGLVDLKQLKSNYEMIKKMIDKKEIISASTVKFGGIGRAIAEMSMGNKIGFKFNEIDKELLFKPLYGSIIVELEKGVTIPNAIILGETIEENYIEINKEIIDLDFLIDSFEKPLEEVFPVYKEDTVENKEYAKGTIIKSKASIVKPRVLVPIFTGSHGEYTMAKSFENAGGIVDTFIFKTLTLKDVETSYKELAEKIKEYQIIGLPDGSILGDEPETGGKLIKLILDNPYIKEEIDNHLYKRDGLILGIGAGFLGLIKSGLISENAYLAHNNSGEFISRLVNVKVKSNLSPWFNEMKVGDKYTVPVATKEGKVIVRNLEELIENGQISTEFIDNNPTGSMFSIESLTSCDGRVLGTISAIDRVEEGLYKNIETLGQHKIFESGVKYFR
ncbi:phosphoribosylformylglycinamidine synthase [Tissierella pigra]|uniref:Phosphoribosylformylglycinamidine synthase n=1 Tax=Tissierella pigra TaxID=2607614 RepID=A0A6N7XEZ5_9FIRM|nr:phosphoribosylformylglycinamidine synthase [Tissierella pigra]MBU5427567.1 phosphoribosylformylglycinamidine synthase [Tissierella pigra]MSU00316.1 phosphoribosylformylglycinamidine synthase [Tissierella pigra]